jgi:opacity protein-like surface antigen
MLRRSTYIITAFILVCGATSDASAQETRAPALPAVEMSAGYAFMRDTTTEQNFPAGWYLSSAANLNHWFGLAGELTGAHKTLSDLSPVDVKANLYTVMGGPRFFLKRGRFVPFAEFLAGVAHLRYKATEPAGVSDPAVSDTKFAFQPGGGVTFLLTDNVSLRGAADYRRIVFTDADEFDEDNSQVRVIAGMVLGWGAR